MTDNMNFRDKLNEIVNDNILTNGEKHTELCFLLSKMAFKHSIPLTYSDDYKEKNKEVIEVFEEITKEISRLNMQP
ncbi:hypothetical protein QRD86_00205 (plasmid) [Bacillus halotolerans]|uniref:hypothetical protein n=1 Tax=Bacillus halotolerans TaxID=260554 RepID=UPI0025700F72|nr:hypothetical protein [Bacillus halotolerans]WJE41210.1 hypothetical protein QRD86_00205 [Bacillus halotolerans]